MSTPQIVFAAPNQVVGWPGATVYVRPGEASYNWTWGLDTVNGSVQITQVSFWNVPPQGSSFNWYLDYGYFQYSIDSGANWTTYNVTDTSSSDRKTTAGQLWRFVNTNIQGAPASAQEDRIGFGFTAGGVDYGTSGFAIKEDAAPTDINSSNTAGFVVSDAPVNGVITTFTPVDTGLTTNGHWSIDSQTHAGAFSLDSNPLTGNTAKLILSDPSQLPADGQQTSVTVRYHDIYQTDSSGVPIAGQGYSETFSYTVKGASYDLDFSADIAVNDTSSDTANQWQPVIATLTNGNYVVVWSDESNGGIYAQRFSNLGVAIGAAITVDSDANASRPSAIALSGGKWVVVYTDYSSYDINYRIVDSSDQVGAKQLAATGEWDQYSAIAVAANAAGDSFEVVWNLADYTTIKRAAFNDAGVQIGVTETLGSDWGYSPSIAILSGGEKVTANVDGVSYAGIYLSLNGTLLNPLSLIGDTWEVPAIAPVGAGFVLVWSSGDSQSIYAQIYDNTGTATSSVITVNSETGTLGGPQVSTLSDGSFVVVWNVADLDGSGLSVHGRRFAADGTALDATEFQVNELRYGDQNYAVVTSLSDARFAVAWVDSITGKTTGADIETRVLLNAGLPLTVSIASDKSSVKAGETAILTFTLSEASSDFVAGDISVTGGVLSNFAGSGTSYTATFTPTANSTAMATIDVAAATFTNAGGDDNTAATQLSIAVDTQRPTATIVMADSALAIGETSLVTFTFSEAVTGFTNVYLTITNGSLSTVSSADGGVTWTATFTPIAGANAAINAITLDNTGVTDTTGNTGTGTTDSNNYVVDTLRPTATIVMADTALSAGETSLVTITFSEVVTGFTNADLTIANGSLSAVSSSDGGITWTATFTPSASTNASTNVISLNNTGVTDTAGNSGAGTTSSDNYAINTQIPSVVSIVVADTALAVGETSLVTFTFSEAVTGFTNADLTIANGSLSAVSSLDGGITWTATFTPSASITSATNVITLDNTGVVNTAGNAGTGTTSSNNYAIDTQRPTATIVMADSALAIGEASLVTFTFSEAVTGFTNADLSIANGSLSAVSSADGGVTWTATFTPTAGANAATNAITLDNTGVTDAAGNAGTGTTDSNNYAIDTQRPTVTIVVTDTALAAGETSLVTFTFSEAVTGFTNADVSIANGSLSTVSSSDGGVTWTATFTPSSNTNTATNLITVDNTGVTDAAGNAGAGTTDSNNFAINTQIPSVVSVVVADTALAVGETSLVTFTFSEAVTGFDNADLIIANGSLSTVSSSDGGITWTATFTPSASITSATNVITLDNTGVINTAGNAGTGTTNSNNYAIDTQRPTATIVMADSALAIGETSLVTFTFSEAVTGFTNADLSIANGSLSAVSSADGGVTWTATFTPTAGANAATNAITLDNTGVTDAAGNAGTGTTDSNNYAIDTQRPTVTIVVTDTALAAGETSLVTFTFSEAVTGFTNADVSIANGSLSTVSSSDGGVTWTATFTPSSNT
ncbi:Ig-like domain-containing protein, partial [Cellvibrio sp. NN19]|uniref:Ig-like domain-containing protein n=1 Tax=Cellvibrio chitinivorans TaxID=3102792 RepID=UPI002B40ECB4